MDVATLSFLRVWRFVATVAMTAALAGCVTPLSFIPAATAPSAADIAFNSLSVRYFDEMLALTPVTATQLGDHRYDARLDDVGTDTRAQTGTLARTLLSELDKIDHAGLSRANQVDAQLLSNELRYVRWQIETLQEWRWNPLLYTNLAGNSIYSLMARDFAPLPDRLNHAASRLQELPRLLSQVREVLVPAKVPKIYAETAVKQNSGILALIDQTMAPQLASLPEADRTRIKAVIARARTAVSQHQIWLERKLVPEAKGEFRMGAALYDAKLGFALASTLSRKDIRSRADAELDRTRAEMYAISRRVLLDRPKAPPLPEQPTPEEQQKGIAAALELAYAEQPARDQVFDFARRALEDARRFVKEKNFITLYDDPVEVIPMPEFQRGVALAYCDPPGPLDKGQKTFYAVSPIPDDWSADQVKSFLREYNSRAIHDLTLHEGIPGHALQLMHSNRSASPLRAALYSGPFVEGWAVYGQRVMFEQGYLDRDPLMQLIQLKLYLRTIANAILDQGVHVDGMTRESAMHLMTHDTFQEEREAAGKWVRVQLSFAQLPTYFVGVQEHLALREEARSRWGQDFDLKRYNDTVLSFGSPPVRYARMLMFDLPIEK